MKLVNWTWIAREQQSWLAVVSFACWSVLTPVSQSFSLHAGANPSILLVTWLKDCRGDNEEKECFAQPTWQTSWKRGSADGSALMGLWNANDHWCVIYCQMLGNYRWRHIKTWNISCLDIRSSSVPSWPVNPTQRRLRGWLLEVRGHMKSRRFEQGGPSHMLSRRRSSISV